MQKIPQKNEKYMQRGKKMFWRIYYDDNVIGKQLKSTVRDGIYTNIHMHVKCD